MLLAIIAGCEIAFWVVLLAGLAARYLLGLRRVSAVLLVCVPLVDLVLLVATILHLRGGATADFTHGLAAAYIGVSVAFGPSTIRWADARFAHRFAGGPAPARPRRYGRARARYEWQEFCKALLAWAISCVLLLGGVVLVGDATRAGALLGWIGRLTFALLIWLIWPISYTLWPSKPKAGDAAAAPDIEQGSPEACEGDECTYGGEDVPDDGDRDAGVQDDVDDHADERPGDEPDPGTGDTSCQRWPKSIPAEQ